VQANPLNAVVAFVQPFQLESIANALRALPNFPGISVSEVQGFGSREAHSPQVGEPTEVDPFRKTLRLEVFCRGADVIAVVETIQRASHTGNAGDGKIFVSPVTLAHRVRTGEWGDNALTERHGGRVSR
jgi:nitrogen regulatory protein PII